MPLLPVPYDTCITSSSIKPLLSKTAAISEFVLESADYHGGIASMRSRTLQKSGLLLAAIVSELFAHGGGLDGNEIADLRNCARRRCRRGRIAGSRRQEGRR